MAYVIEKTTFQHKEPTTVIDIEEAALEVCNESVNNNNTKYSFLNVEYDEKNYTLTVTCKMDPSEKGKNIWQSVFSKALIKVLSRTHKEFKEGNYYTKGVDGKIKFLRVLKKELVNAVITEGLEQAIKKVNTDKNTKDLPEAKATWSKKK